MGRSMNKPLKRSLYAGSYLFLCAVVLVVATSQVTGLVAEVLVVPAGSTVWLAIPVPVIGAVVWWALVKRQGTTSYVVGSIVGLGTAVLTLLVWILVGVLVWGPEGVLAGWPLIIAVLVPTIPIALVAGLSVMYARCRLDEW